MAPPKGSSNNPNGRPKKETALTDMLKVALGHTYPVGDRKISGKRILSDMVSRAVVTGRIRFPNDSEESVISIKDWLELVRWVYERVDGKPVQPVGGDSELGPIIVRMVNDAGS